MQEYYIRNPDVDESRGPFTIEQLTSLAETGNITLETLIYDPASESWEVIEHHESRTHIFPERKRLTFREKSEFESLNTAGELDIPAITIDDLLAAAEGTSEETKHRKKEGVWKEKAATLAMLLAAVAFILSAIGNIWVQRDPLFSFDMGGILKAPLILFGFFDLALALILFLQSTAVYPFVRFRAMLGAGFGLFYFWAAGYPLVGIVAAIGSLGIYGLTIFLKLTPFIIFATLAILGMGAYAFMAFGI